MGNLMIGNIYPPFLGQISKVMCGAEQCWPAEKYKAHFMYYVNLGTETRFLWEDSRTINKYGLDFTVDYVYEIEVYPGDIRIYHSRTVVNEGLNPSFTCTFYDDDWNVIHSVHGGFEFPYNKQVYVDIVFKVTGDANKWWIQDFDREINPDTSLPELYEWLINPYTLNNQLYTPPSFRDGKLIYAEESEKSINKYQNEALVNTLQSPPVYDNVIIVVDWRCFNTIKAYRKSEELDIPVIKVLFGNDPTPSWIVNFDQIPIGATFTKGAYTIKWNGSYFEATIDSIRKTVSSPMCMVPEKGLKTWKLTEVDRNFETAIKESTKIIGIGYTIYEYGTNEIITTGSTSVPVKNLIPGKPYITGSRNSGWCAPKCEWTSVNYTDAKISMSDYPEFVDVNKTTTDTLTIEEILDETTGMINKHIDVYCYTWTSLCMLYSNPKIKFNIVQQTPEGAAEKQKNVVFNLNDYFDTDKSHLDLSVSTLPELDLSHTIYLTSDSLESTWGTETNTFIKKWGTILSIDTSYFIKDDPNQTLITAWGLIQKFRQSTDQTAEILITFKR